MRGSPNWVRASAPNSNGACVTSGRRAGQGAQGHKKALLETPNIATRKSSEAAIEASSPRDAGIPRRLGRSDRLQQQQGEVGRVAFSAKTPGRYIHYGIREHGMAAAMNGIFLHGGFAPNGATFLVFTDYCRPAMRLAALMGPGDLCDDP